MGSSAELLLARGDSAPIRGDSALYPNMCRINHSLYFIDPITGVHTQTNKSYWSAKKAPLKTMHGCSNLKLLNSYLAELMSQYCTLPYS